MSTIHIVYGPQGAGKTTYSKALAREENALHLSIDEWMIQLFGPDTPKPMSYSWIMERVQRCESRIWTTAREVGKNIGSVVLDLGFMKEISRTEFLNLTLDAGLMPRLHYVTAPHDVRRNRVLARNVEKGETYSFEVTPMMFDFMESKFEKPNEGELSNSVLFDTHAVA